MYKRFLIICSVIAAALLVLSVLGLSSLGMHEKGLRAERQQEFIAVAKQVSFDVKKRVDAFLQTEQARPYTDYQYYYVPVASNQAAALVRSPLGQSISNGMAYGYFQLDNTGDMATPYAAAEQEASGAVKKYLEELKSNLLPSLGNGGSMRVRRIEPAKPKDDYEDRLSIEAITRRGRLEPSHMPSAEPAAMQKAEEKEQPVTDKKVAAKSKGDSPRRTTYPISLDESRQQTQVLSQSRANYELNITNGAPQQQPQREVADSVQQQAAVVAEQPAGPLQEQPAVSSSLGVKEENKSFAQQGIAGQSGVSLEADVRKQQADDRQQTLNDVVQVRIEPFVPMTVPEANGKESVFAGQVFLLRHIQIEDKHLVQGFRLDESQLLKQVAESVQQFVRQGMGFDISKTERADAAYTAVLDFGFGEVVLNLTELQPGWIGARVVQIRDWFFAILGVVWLAVIIALAAMWRNMVEQVQLSHKKDDFISAVSHELRTPLTSIRMYTEMLEKDWVKDEAKRREYYVTMRQESERLTRLIENVLDFSRIQRGKKQFDFTMGDVNGCVRDVAEMMRPCAERAGFTIEAELTPMEPFAFDRDAVTQIVINLTDNALKYAKDASDKRIVVRTRPEKGYAVIEVEDHGSGVPKSQHKKIFEAFYRCGDESTRQTTGTGLGLALVKRFVQAHHGVVEVFNAKPTGALFRVRIAR